MSLEKTPEDAHVNGVQQQGTTKNNNEQLRSLQ
jgi:hypothetical protein